MEAMTGWELFRAHLQQPEYLHVLLNPLPVYGLALGFLALLVAISLRERRADFVALTIVFVSAVSAWPVAEFGEHGYDRVISMADPPGDAWLDEHAARANKVLWVFFVVAGLAVVTVVVPMKFPGAARPLLLATLIGTAACLGCGAWIGYAGGQVRHPEFRYGRAPAAKPGGERQEAGTGRHTD